MRTFPKPDQQTLINFIYHSVRLDRLPIKYDDIKKSLGKKEGDPDIDPHALGHFKAINLALRTAAEEDILRDPHSWLKRLNLHISSAIADYDLISLSPQPLLKSACGTYRNVQTKVGSLPAPAPLQIPQLIERWKQPLIKMETDLAPKIQNPRLLTPDDLKRITSTCFDAHIQLYAIQPFQEGSNRTARVVENLLRLHFLLPWRIHSSDDDHLKTSLAESARVALASLK